jgi:hypothetical protein
MKLTRSVLFSAALHEYVARHADDEVTETVNAALLAIGEEQDSSLRPFLREAARRTLNEPNGDRSRRMCGGSTSAIRSDQSPNIVGQSLSFKETI